jgi:NDP-sugar pyrophosphorylase family protein
MNIIVLMAGRGQRFRDKGYTIPKPLIPVNGKTILEWTTESCPYIMHGGVDQTPNIRLYFAVLEDYINDELVEFLHRTYGKNISIIPFTHVTRGSLDTAYIVTKLIPPQHQRDPLLVLDSDNKYSENGMVNFYDSLPNRINTTAVACFNNPDISLPNKWSNVKIENGTVVGIREKDDAWIIYPKMIGVFYFNDTAYFKNEADYIMTYESPVGFASTPEFYMSMVACRNIKSTYAHIVENVVPLGTPEQLQQFMEEA